MCFTVYFHYILIDFLYMWYDAALNIEIEHFYCCFLKTTGKWIICMFLDNGWKLWLLLALKWLQLFFSGENVGDKCKKPRGGPELPWTHKSPHDTQTTVTSTYLK